MMTSDQAWRQMRYLAKLLRERKPIPAELADFIAQAIEAAEGKDISAARKGKAFTDELELTALNRRKLPVDLRELTFDYDFCDDPSLRKFTSRMASTYGVSEATIRNRLQDIRTERRRETEEMAKEGWH